MSPGKRLRYETWYYLHLYTYLALALAFSHQFAVGASIVSNLAARFWWSALYLVVAVLVLWYRVVVPLHAASRHGFRAAGIRQEAPRTVSIYVKGRRLREPEAEPGQFFRCRPARCGCSRPACTGWTSTCAVRPVQVQLAVKANKIVKVAILEQPTSTEHDLQIGQFAFPKLIAETTSSQSARIDSVSGATYTSGGYIKSLQSALDNGV